MMKMKIMVIMALSAIFSACLAVTDDYARIVIKNNAASDIPAITALQTHEPGSTSWISRFNGYLYAGEEETITLPPGNYDVRITVSYILYERTFETGYMNYVEAKPNEYNFLIFDGNGLYKMEDQK
jgi:hypothetical protein